MMIKTFQLIITYWAYSHLIGLKHLFLPAGWRLWGWLNNKYNSNVHSAMVQLADVLLIIHFILEPHLV